MIKVNYDDMVFHYITRHYDVHWSGTCIYDGKIAEFITHDETDYQHMNDTCPSCYYGALDKYCHCESFTDLWCEIIPLPLWKQAILHIRKLYYKHRYHTRYAY